ncbi:hypothetical protein OTU49_000336 [Cherax quadricarinatus]|uniref:Large ribosomal subunit protein P2 n=1 Tax=Cherax quadricarinatus TaxID=27406 RepID=A0AAW0Y0S7_CHEQU|nr:60S acidic ribosomal protein P2-like [Cherax quadricarinatus]
MRYVAAYCLAALGGGSPSVKDIEKVLSSVSIDCDAALAKKVISELQGKNLEQLINEGLSKIGSLPAGGGGGGVGIAAGGGGKPAAAAAAAAAPAEKKEEKKPEEPEEESDDDMGFGLFD